MAENAALRRLLWAVVSVVLVAGLAAVPVVGDEGDELERAGSERPTSTTSAGSAAGGGGDAGGAAGDDGQDGDVGVDGSGAGAGPAPSPTTTVPAGASASTTAPTTPPTFPPPPDELGTPVDPGPPSPPRPGAYRYRTSGSAAGGEGGDGESTTTVADEGRVGDETRLTLTTTSDREVTITAEVSWRPGGVRTRRWTFAFGDRKGECDWEPDVVEAVFPLRPGATWTSTSTCAVTGATPTPIPLTRTTEAEVVDLRRTRVAGVVVDVWAIRRVERLEGGGMSGQTTALALFSPKHGLDVEISGSGSGGGRSGDYRQELLALEPEPA
ncbi:MAG TPA: hypothetical protein VM933_02075 [Acidimicrobiales bacterium]|nr:hypothetical protein [Acidimicrobiales bacterium]